MQRRRTRPISLPAAAAFGVALGALLIIALFPIFPRQLDIRVGDTASRTLESPRSVSFDSEYLTAQRRQQAADAVPPTLIYDPAVRDAQVEQYNATVAQITQIRNQDTDIARKRDVL